MGRALTTKRGRLNSITLYQSNLFCWDVGSSTPDGVLDHLTMYTYTDGSSNKYIIRCSAANNGIEEEVVPSWYWTRDANPYVCYFNAIGIGG
ncbi:MAG: hypothetical protein K6T75_04695 [Acetobacteraceae bacterium]|nr:hypothetical protein [Acetobacteraceae bacterium]